MAMPESRLLRLPLYRSLVWCLHSCKIEPVRMVKIAKTL